MQENKTYNHFMRMKKSTLTTLIFFLSFTLLKAQKTDTCIIKTSLGEMTIELYSKKAPLTVANFLKYVDAHLYDGTSFFRTVRLDNQPKDSIKIEVVQGGHVNAQKAFAPIMLETTKQTGLHHLGGTLSMARSTPNSAASDFFICINDQPSLDYGGKRNNDGQGFAAFGKVIAGMEVVRKIQQLYPGQEQYINPTVLILNIIRKK